MLLACGSSSQKLVRCKTSTAFTIKPIAAAFTSWSSPVVFKGSGARIGAIVQCGPSPVESHLPATCVRICMLLCSAASGSLYSPAFPVSTSSSFTFIWFRRSRNNLQSHSGVSLRSRTHSRAWWLPLFQLTSPSAPGIASPDPASHPDIPLSSARSLHRPFLHGKKES